MKTDLSRRRFLEPLLGTAILLLIPGCGGGGDSGYDGAPATQALAAIDSPGAPVATSSAGCGTAIDFNHGHLLIVLKSDLDSTTARSYDIQGGADHTHTVTVTLAQLAALKSGASVTVASTETDYHQHVITVSCV
jgi:hypothetical protein